MIFEPVAGIAPATRDGLVTLPTLIPLPSIETPVAAILCLVRGRLRIAVWANQAQIRNGPVIRVSVDVIENQRSHLRLPHRDPARFTLPSTSFCKIPPRTARIL